MLEIAYYYPELIWRDPAWIKNLLLFFDGVALLVPPEFERVVEETDPAIVLGLQEHGLLHLLAPEDLIDRKAAETLIDQLAGLLTDGVFDDIVRVARPMAGRLSLSRLGRSADPELADMLLAELRARGLADTVDEEGRSVSLNWVVRLVVLVLLAQVVRPRAAVSGLLLSPATDQSNIHEAVAEMLALPSMISAGHVVSLDLAACSVDLSSVPIEDILAFRAEHGDQYAAYRREVRGVLRQLAVVAEPDRKELMSDRRGELVETARDLAAASRRWWRTPATVGLGVAGAVWTAATGDPLGGVLAASTAGLAAWPGRTQAPEAVSYLFRSHELAV